MALFPTRGALPGRTSLLGLLLCLLRVVRLAEPLESLHAVIVPPESVVSLGAWALTARAVRELPAPVGDLTVRLAPPTSALSAGSPPG